MSARNDLVLQALRAAGIDSTITYFASAAPTAVSAAEKLGVELGAIANSLIFMSGEEPVLIMTSGAHRVDTAFVAANNGIAPLTRATPDQVRAATGQVIGGVAPAGHPAPVRTFVDRALATHDVVWTAGGTPESMVDMTYDQLLTLTHGKETHVEPQ